MKYLIESEFDKAYDELSILNESYITKLKRALNTEDGRAKLNDKDYSKNWGTDRVFKFLNDIDLSAYFNFIDSKLIENEKNGTARYPEDTDEQLQAHHIIFNAIGGGEDLSNLIALSIRDHFDAHNFFLECIVNHLKSHPEDQPKFAWAVHHATNSLVFVAKSKELIDDLKGESLDNFNEYISRVNSDKSVNRKTLTNKGTKNITGGSDGAVYELNWVDSNEPELVTGLAAIQKRFINKFGKTKSIDMLKKWTAIRDELGNIIQKNPKYTGWKDFNLKTPLIKVADSNSHDTAHKSEYFIYFNYLDNGLIDYSTGYLSKGKGAIALKKSILGDDKVSGKVDLAYQKADEAHNLLLAGKLPYKRALSNRNNELDKFNSVMFIYAKDLPLLQQILNKYNSTVGNYDDLMQQYKELEKED